MAIQHPSGSILRTVPSAARRLVRKGVRACGYDIRPLSGLGTDGTDKIADIHRLFGAQPANVVIDVGANIGQTALQYASDFQDAKIFSFEPSPHAFAKLVKNTVKYRQVVPVQAAVGDIPGRASFPINAEDTTSSFLPASDEAGKYHRSEAFAVREVVEVEVVTLDQFAAANEIISIDPSKDRRSGLRAKGSRGSPRAT